jgi:hypothetical protein
MPENGCPLLKKEPPHSDKIDAYRFRSGGLGGCTMSRGTMDNKK